MAQVDYLAPVVWGELAVWVAKSRKSLWGTGEAQIQKTVTHEENREQAPTMIW